jgi:hypothetical protein
MVVSEITLFNTLKAKLGEQEAQTIVEGIKQSVRDEFQSKATVFATKEDLANTKVDLIKWMVGFWVAQMAAIIGIYFKG